VWGDGAAWVGAYVPARGYGGPLVPVTMQGYAAHLAREAIRLQAGVHAPWCPLLTGPQFSDVFTWPCACGVAAYQTLVQPADRPVPQEAASADPAR
jgi:hypothetical protein